MEVPETPTHIYLLSTTFHLLYSYEMFVDVINCEKAHEAWCKFSGVFTCVIDEVAPVKEVRLKQRSQL